MFFINLLAKKNSTFTTKDKIIILGSSLGGLTVICIVIALKSIHKYKNKNYNLLNKKIIPYEEVSEEELKNNPLKIYKFKQENDEIQSNNSFEIDPPQRTSGELEEFYKQEKNTWNYQELY